jgi:uncharacterized protein with PQ loop repeat
MFCQKCGTLINANLNYCNNCGAKTTKNEDEKKFSPLGLLITTLAFVSVCGLGILVGLIAILLDKFLHPEPIIALSFFYLLTLFSICFFIIKQISKLTDLHIQERTQTVQPFYQNPQISAPNTAQLEEPKQQPISVTENTTKTLDEILLKRS